MKIGFIVVEEFPGIISSGGIGVFVKNISKGLADKGLDVEVFLIHHQSLNVDHLILDNLRINLIYIPVKKNLFARIYNIYKTHKEIYKFLIFRGISIVEVSTSDNYFYKSFGKILVIARTHGSITYAIKNYYRKSGQINKYLQLWHEFFLLKKSIRILAISQQYFDHYISLTSKMILVENFIGAEYDSLDEKNNESGEKYLFYHGTLKDIKGVIELVLSFRKSQYYDTHQLVLAGKSDTEMVSLIYEIGGNKVKYLGEIKAEQLRKFLRNADLTIYPSKRDAFNLSVVEAMSQKCKILVSDAIDRNIIQDQINGIRFPLYKINSFEYYLDFCYNYADWNTLQENAYNDFKKKYSYVHGIESNYEFYLSMK